MKMQQMNHLAKSLSTGAILGVHSRVCCLDETIDVDCASADCVLVPRKRTMGWIGLFSWSQPYDPV